MPVEDFLSSESFILHNSSISLSDLSHISISTNVRPSNLEIFTKSPSESI